MSKRITAIVLCLALLMGICLPGQASVTSLDRALSRWLEDQTQVRFSMTMDLKTLMPYNEQTLALLNGVLKHVTVDASITQNGDDSDTQVNIALDSASVADYTESVRGGTHTLTTSLLPNRTLSSAKASPLDLLAAPENAQTADKTEDAAAALEAAQPAPTPVDTPDVTEAADTVDAVEATDTVASESPDAPPIAEPAVTAAPTAETAVTASGETEIAEAFNVLDAVTELQACYQALTDGIKAFATEKRANYNIKGIGAGRWSRIARLTVEQSQGLLKELRAVLSSGMDAAYRSEIAQATFEKGFIVALYQNADNQDICVYLKGNIDYPDGTVRKLTWQWAFNTNGLKRKDMFTYKVSKLNGTADTRTVEATCTQESLSNQFSILSRAETSLKRAGTTDTCVEKINLSGEKDKANAVTCKGELSQECTRSPEDADVRSTEEASVDLTFTPEGSGSALTGTIGYQTLLDKVVQKEINLTFAAPSDLTADTEEPAEAEVIVTSPVTETTASVGQSSIDQLDADTSETAGAEEHTDYLVGSAPIGLKTYTPPQTLTAVDMDSADVQTLESILAEAAQNFAGKLLIAVANLPEEDAGLLKDGMTEQDYAAFQSLIDAL